MLKGIDALLTGDLLKMLCDLGHGDEVVVADANFTTRTLGVGKPIIALPGISVLRTCEALLPLFPLDEAVQCPVSYMQVSDTPAGFRSRLQREVTGWLVNAGHAQEAQFEAVERFAFYERVRRAQAIIHTGEMQPYANFIFKKGVIADSLAI